jgi:transcriptional regulator with XRE-family HTH domain
MSNVRHIRQSIFRLTQREFAEVAGVTQASVSRWENGTPPSHPEMQAIRDAAIGRGIPWDDRWFFEAPAGEVAA